MGVMDKVPFTPLNADEVEHWDTWWGLREKGTESYYAGSFFNGKSWEHLFDTIENALQFPTKEHAQLANVGGWEVVPLEEKEGDEE